MHKLIKAFEKNSLPNNMLLDIYGISTRKHYDCVFVAPSWTPDKIFDASKVKVEQIFAGRFANTYHIKNSSKNYLFITLQIGAPNIIDFCLLCYKVKCDNFIFIGSVGALVPEIKVGDVIIPEHSISGNGATLYLHEKLDKTNIFEPMYSTPDLNKQIIKTCKKHKIKALDVPVISMDSVMSEYLHLDEFRTMGAKAIEMECATFFGCMSIINKKSSAVLVVSDNSATGEHLIGRTEEDKKHYHSVRKQIGKILLEI